MASDDLKDKSADELATELEELYREQFNLRMQKGSGQDVRPHHFKRVRRRIARVKTLMNQQSTASV